MAMRQQYIFCWNLTAEKKKLPSHELGCMAMSEHDRDRS